MDVSTIAMSLISGQSQVTAASTAAIMIRQNLDSQQAIVDMLTSSSASANQGATLASHLGTNLDVSA